MRSDTIKKGIERAPHRALLRATGCTPQDFERPFIGVINSFNTIVPGHMHLRSIADAVIEGVRAAGGVPFELNTMAACDGIAENHLGMRYILPSREVIADSIEIMAHAHALDALVFIPNCDKIVPGMLIAAVRLNLPSVFVSGGLPCSPGGWTAGVSTSATCTRRWDSWSPARLPRRTWKRLKASPAPDRAAVRRWAPPAR